MARKQAMVRKKAERAAAIDIRAPRGVANMGAMMVMETDHEKA